jgi:hypothetical protein
MPCIFCGDPKTTNEHVFPQWTRTVIPGEGPITHEWTAPEGSASESRAWVTDDLFTFQAKAVCQKTCNGGWMNDLERRARPFLEPMIRGQAQTLRREGRRAVGFWALKTAMMIDLAQEREHRSVPPDAYPALYRAHAVLPNTIVWLGATTFGAGAGARHRTLHVEVDDAQREGFGASMHIGHLVIETIHVEVQKGKVLEIRGDLAHALRRLWPQDRAVLWPPAAVLSRDQVYDLGTLVEDSPTVLKPAPDPSKPPPPPRKRGKGKQKRR